MAPWSWMQLPDEDFQRGLVALIPTVRGFAHALTRNHALAEDLAQDAVLKAWKGRARFEAGTNLRAWLFTILRNELYSHGRREWRQTAMEPEQAERLVGAEDPEAPLHLADLRQAMFALPIEQREALTLVAAAGLSYDEAARVVGVATGTVKSRVSRARASLQALLEQGSQRSQDIAPHQALDAIMDDAARLTASHGMGASDAPEA